MVRIKINYYFDALFFRRGKECTVWNILLRVLK